MFLERMERAIALMMEMMPKCDGGHGRTREEGGGLVVWTKEEPSSGWPSSSGPGGRCYPGCASGHTIGWAW
jgi:hypothetical protein